MKGKLLRQVLVVLALAGGGIGTVESSNVAQANAAWEGSGYMVLQNETHLKTFDNLTDAINYAKQ